MNIQDLPDALKGYAFHGVDLTHTAGNDAVADCPFCGKERKFYITEDTGQWQCKVCMSGSSKGGGNIYTFLRELHRLSDEGTSDYSDFMENRSVLKVETMMRWGVCRSAITDEWLVPGFSPDGKLNNLYRYVVNDAGKGRLWSTPKVNHQLFGGGVQDHHEEIYISESVWDSTVLEETLSHMKEEEDGYTYLPDASSESMLSRIAVIATPSANVFTDAWATHLAGKRIIFFSHNDHPREKKGRTIEPPSFIGIKRAYGILVQAGHDPNLIGLLPWGGDSDHDPALKDGYDIRDALSEGKTIEERVEILSALLEKIVLAPQSWAETVEPTEAKTQPALPPVACDSWPTLSAAWHKAMKMTEGLDRGLSISLAVILSTESKGEQLWCKMIGPPSCGKSTICDALDVARKYTVMPDTFTGFHSGMRGKDGKDNSPIAGFLNKTLIIKDGDTLLQNPNLAQILGDARVIYDRKLTTVYKNGMKQAFNGSMTFLLNGTPNIRAIDDSELGERFLDCIIMDGVDDDLEDEVLLMIARRTARHAGERIGKDVKSQHTPEKVEAMQLTGGYINYLRENGEELIQRVELRDPELIRCTRLGKFVAYMRSRPDDNDEGTHGEREFGGRLVAQIIMLAKCLSAVLQRPVVDEEVMRRVTQTALDTATGRILTVIQNLRRFGAKGLAISALAVYVNRTDTKVLTDLAFLKHLGAVESFSPITTKSIQHRVRWRLTPRLIKLCDSVLGTI